MGGGQHLNSETSGAPLNRPKGTLVALLKRGALAVVSLTLLGAALPYI